VPHVPRCGFTAFLQLIRGVLTDRFVESVPKSGIVLLGSDEGAIDESGENIDDSRRLDAIASAHCLDVCERGTTGESRQTAQQTAFRIREQVITLLDHCTKSSVPRLRSARAREQVEVRFQPRCKILE